MKNFKKVKETLKFELMKISRIENFKIIPKNKNYFSSAKLNS